jgi:hypothetical protein
MYVWEKWEMATQVERISVLETKVDGLKEDVREMHDCLDKTRESLTSKLDEMYAASCSQHASLAKELGDVKKFKDKWTYTIFTGLAVLGWVTGHIDTIAKFLN